MTEHGGPVSRKFFCFVAQTRKRGYWDVLERALAPQHVDDCRYRRSEFAMSKQIDDVV
jgi:hypothetical protein